MSESVSSSGDVRGGVGAAAWRGWGVRPAVPDDAPAVSAAVAELLRELGATPPEPAAMEAAAGALLADASAGAVLVAVAGEDQRVVGVLAASWQLALHVPGPYGLIQDLWVDAAWRDRGVGAALVAALLDAATARGIGRVEVGVPRDGFPGLAATRRFYERCGFAFVGARLRWSGAS